MLDPVFIHAENYKVRSYETDMNGCATIKTICNYMQNSGFNHALALQRAGGITSDPAIAYFLTRQRVHVYRYPRWKEEITLVSWLDPRVKGYAVREFEVSDRDGNIIVCATNSALFYNLNERKVVRLAEDHFRIPDPERPRALDDPFDPLPRMSNPGYRSEIMPRMLEIDMYRHVNNGVYVEWALETLPAELWDGWMLVDHEINFRREVNPGETVISEAEEVSGDDCRVFLHRLSIKSDGREAVLLRTCWSRKK